MHISLCWFDSENKTSAHLSAQSGVTIEALELNADLMHTLPFAAASQNTKNASVVLRCRRFEAFCKKIYIESC